MPGVRFSFEPADIVSEVMSFGSPTPVEVAVSGPSLADDRAYAEKVRDELAKVPSLRDLQYVQALDYPTVNVEIDRERAGLSGVSVAEVARSLVAATSSSRFVVPNYWPDPKTGIGYQVQVEIPYRRHGLGQPGRDDPDPAPGRRRRCCSATWPGVSAGTMPGEYDRYNMKRTVSLTANIAGEDLGRVAGRDRPGHRSGPATPPKGVTVDVRGQIAPMKEMLRGLAIGLGMAIVVILLLLTANFQSVRLALVVDLDDPGGRWRAWSSPSGSRGTTINIQSFMGAIMAIGVAVANAILLVTFAERHRREGAADAAEAAVDGAKGRLRPILMTSCAMIAGMVAAGPRPGARGASRPPRSAGPSSAGSSPRRWRRSSSSRRVFAIVQGSADRHSASLDPFDPASAHYHPEADELTHAVGGNGTASIPVTSDGGLPR